MKKLIFFLTAMMVLISCSDDDGASETNTNGTRLVKAVSTSPEGVNTSEYFYNGNHLIELESDGSSSYFGYSNDLLVSATNDETSVINYEYNDQGKLVYQHYDNGSVRYVYNTDGTVTVTDYDGVEVPENIRYVTTLYFEEGELVKKVIASPADPNVLTYTFTYDEMNNPNLNKQGYYGAFFYSSWSSYVIGNAHNLLDVFFESTSGSEYHYSYQYDYNSNGFPTQQRQLNPEGNPTGVVTNFYYE